MCLRRGSSDRMDILMRVGMIGTGAISHKHAQAYRNIGYQLTVCTDIFAEAGRAVRRSVRRRVRRHLRGGLPPPEVDYVDVCTFPDFRLEPVEICAQTRKHMQVQKPISTNARDRPPDDRNRPQGRNPAGRGEPAPFRRFQPVPVQSTSPRAAWAGCSSAIAT